jgi:hypothetical protein
MHLVFGRTFQDFVNQSGRALRDLCFGKRTLTLPFINSGDALGFWSSVGKFRLTLPCINSGDALGFGRTVQDFVNQSGRALRDLCVGKFRLTLPCINSGDALGFW